MPHDATTRDPRAPNDSRPRLWDEIVRSIAEARSTEQRAARIVGRLHDELGRPDAAGLAMDHLQGVVDSGLYELICGGGRSSGDSPGVRAQRDVALFWHAVRALAADQSRGFALPEAASPKEVVDRTFDRTFADESFEGFWSPGRAGEHAGPADSETFRHYIVWSLARAVLPAIQDDAREVLGGLLIESIGNEDVVSPDGPASTMPTRPRERFAYLRRLELERQRHSVRSHLDERYEPAAWRRKRAAENHVLFEHLERLLTRGAEQNVALEMGLLLRVLCGRYLNPESDMEEWWVPTLREGIRYVLGRQLKPSGELDELWGDLLGDRPSSLVQRASPLIYILDLENRLLAPHLPLLLEATASALSRLRRRLAVYDGSWSVRTGGTHVQDVKSLFRLVVAALSLGALAYDRLRDLLSDEILGERRAVIPSVGLTWDSVPESLGFRDNLERGVIEKWLEWDPRRPGAILVYGPPGTGKTTIAKLIAQRLNASDDSPDPGEEWRFLELTPADFAREGADRIVASAERLFAELRHVRRCVVLMDEMEEFLRTRTPDSDKESRLITTAFLPLLQEVVSSREIILVVATNFVGNIDPAMTRRGRFDLILPLGPPGRCARENILEGSAVFRGARDRLRDQCPEAAKRFMAIVAEYTMGYSASELNEFLLDLDHVLKRSEDQLESCADLEIELWRMRTERVPTALSGRAGCSWGTFADEARRYVRPAGPGGGAGAASIDDEDYWKEPTLPGPDRRRPASPGRGAPTPADRGS